MIYFKTSEIIFSIYSSAILGVIFGILYSSSLETLGYLKKFISLPFQCLKNARKFSVKRIFIISFEKNNTKISKISKNIYEFLIFTLFGCFTIILSYIALDGVFRLYVLVIIGFFFMISKSTIGNFSRKTLSLIYSCIYFTLSFILTPPLIPITKLSILLNEKSVRIINAIKRKIGIMNSDRLKRKKTEELRKELKVK